MFFMLKCLIKYVLIIGSFFGLFPFNFQRKNILSNINKNKIFLLCLLQHNRITFVILLPLSSYIIFVFLSNTPEESESSIVRLVYSYKLIAQVLTYIMVVWTFIIHNTSKITKLVMTGIELFHDLDGDLSKLFPCLILLQNLFLEWVCGALGFWTNNKYTKKTVQVMFTSIVTSICGMINIFVQNIFFFVICCAGISLKKMNQ